MNKKNQVLTIVLSFLSAMLLVIGVFGFGIFIGNKWDFNQTTCIMVLVIDFLVGLLSFINMFRTRRYNKFLENKKGEEIFPSLLQQKEEALQNVNQSYQAILKSYKNVCFFLTGFYLFLLLLLFTNGLIAKSCSTTPLIAIYTILIMVFIIGLLCAVVLIFEALYTKLFIHPKSENENKYPLIYQFVKQICEEEGIDKDIEIVLIDQVNIAISEQKNQLVIAIGLYFLKFYTRDEIRSIIYHELAHYKQKHTKLSKEKVKYVNILEILLPKDLYIFIYPKILFVSFHNEILEHITTIYYETKADDEVLNKNVGQDYATAEVKSFGLSYAYKLPRYDIEYLLSLKHQWDQEIIEKLFSGYLSFYNQHVDFFIFAAKNHLEARLPTHPNVKQRVEKFATSEINPIIISSHEFDEDIFKFYLEVNQKQLRCEKKEVFDQFIKDYEEYQNKKEKAMEIGLKMNCDELLSLMDQAFQYGEMEFAKACAIKIIETSNGDTVRAHFILGIIEAFYEFDDDCIKHLQMVYEDGNNQFFADAFHSLGEYACITGKEELLNSLREKTASAYDGQKEQEYILNINLKDKLKPFTNEEVIHHIIAIAKENDEVEMVCIGTKESAHRHCHQVLLLISNKAKNHEKIDETAHQIWLYLDLEDDFYNLTVLPLPVIPTAHPFRKKPICVYNQKEYKKHS